MPLFKNGAPAGELVATTGALESGVDIKPLIQRHLNCDWGELCPEDLAQNDESMKDGGMIMSAYIVNGITLWVITDAGHEVTTVLLPSEY